MTKKFAIGAASIAIMASLATNAQAQVLAEANLVDTRDDTMVNEAQDGANGETAKTESTVTVRGGDIDPFYRNIDPFYGNIDPFYGDIDAFWKNISPFYGNIDPFWKNISPFYGNIGAFWGNIDPFYGNIGAFTTSDLQQVGAFWKDISPFFTSTDATWALLENADPMLASSKSLEVQQLLEELVQRSEAQWGQAVTSQTGRSFQDGFVNGIFARHGIDPNDPSTLVGFTQGDRARFFLDWHDSLMTFVGIDHPDHWMGAVNWTPALTRTQGEGADTIIGIVDGSFSSDSDLGDNIVWSGGGTTTVSGHGAGVASLIGAAHDGEGVMGIAPSVRIATYNPFDSNAEATWDSVGDGIEALIYQHVGGGGTGYASIINLSLGESGWAFSQGLADQLNRPRIAAYNDETIYVVAAGNDGVSQTGDIDWNFDDDTTFILVGSTNPLGNISSFSNTPGSACLLNNGVCAAGNELYMRTIVAPGELLLVSDGKGGIMRASGTSFAAPLVSGAIALMHDRWPWLSKHPEETAEIIFKSAKDLGAPGPDEVYGWGMLDVTASQSPLDFNNLTWYQWQPNLFWTKKTYTNSSKILSDGVQSWWESKKVYFSMFEYIGDTHRDFVVPMSSLLYDTKSRAGGSLEYMQSFITGRLINWINSGGADSNGDGKAGLTDIRSGRATPVGGWSLHLNAMAPRYTDDGWYEPMHSAATLTAPDGRMSFTLGHGQGAVELAGNRFGLVSDHNQQLGGVNPVLGFASGETFASASYKLSKNTKVTFGFTENRKDVAEIDGITRGEEFALRGLDGHSAHAFTLDIEQKVAKNLTVNAQYTRLSEEKALLGVQSTFDSFLGQGTSTDALTVSAGLDLGYGISFDLSSTAARTATRGEQAIATGSGVWSSAGQFAVTKQGVVGRRDKVRLSVAQPLTVEDGELEFRSVGVVDRQTGEIGELVQNFSIEGKRRIVGEAVYATPLGKKGELGIFGRYQSEGSPGETENYIFGGTVSLTF